MSKDCVAKISSVAWSPNNLKLAACNSDRIVVLFDENGEKRDKFSTKPGDQKVLLFKIYNLKLNNFWFSMEREATL